MSPTPTPKPPIGLAGITGSILFVADAAAAATAAAAGELRSASGGSKLDSASFSNKIESTGDDSFDRLKDLLLKSI